MIVTKEEKEVLEDTEKRFKELMNDYQNMSETLLELLSFMRGICMELEPTNPAIAGRIYNKAMDILSRQDGKGS